MKLIRRDRGAPIITTVMAFILAFVFIESGDDQGATGEVTASPLLRRASFM
jgi:hypothetical protein